MHAYELLLKLQNHEIELKTQKNKSKIDDLNSEIILLKAQLPTEIVTRFYRLFKRYENALVRANGGVCNGCFLNLPSSQAAVMNKCSDISTCQHCGRFIYYDTEKANAIF
ncbi:MAG: C4-type zinc ribbon domain-containing protein [Candidatus Auribacterota bacterium]|jgi:predicted  nucleic acid-binding Zn-ribbon protein|nr:C4-type zinc ribbon domain-containing protein [Candidatus Auribacterota bacterium]